jgi:hypothetical protein
MNVNYRVLRHVRKLPTGGTEVILAVHEVFLDGQGLAYGKSPRPAELVVSGRGELTPDFDALKGILTEILKEIVTHPIQDASAIPEAGAQNPHLDLTPKGPSDRLPTEPGRL